MNKRPIYIFDIDGTLANIEHRVHILSDDSIPDKWREFYSRCDEDSPNLAVINVMESLARHSTILFFSGRSAEVMTKTLVWLDRHTSFSEGHIRGHNLLTMRDIGDYTPDHELKESWLKGMLKGDVDRIAGVFDDRSSVVSMWRRNGLTCFQVAEGKF